MTVLSHHSYFLWRISRPEKSGVPQHDLSAEGDKDLHIFSGASTLKLKYERVIAKVFRHYAPCN